MKGCGGESLACMQKKQVDVVAPSISPVKRRRFTEDSSRCTKFDGYPMENLKHGHQENEIRIGFEFGTPEKIEELQGSDVQKKTTSRAKRTKCVYVTGNTPNSTDSARHTKSSDIPPIPYAVDGKSSKAAKPICSKSTECNSSSSPQLEDLDSDGVSKPSGTSKQLSIKELKDQNINESTKKPDKTTLSESVYTNHCAATETGLVDVHLTIQANNRAENVPFVCLTSKVTGKAILGYPIEIGELHDDSFEAMLPGNKNAHRLVWRTCRRTPVCYITNSLSSSSSVSKTLQGRKRSKAVGESIPLAKEVLSSSSRGWGPACVPVEAVFGKMLAAVGQVRS